MGAGSGEAGGRRPGPPRASPGTRHMKNPMTSSAPDAAAVPLPEAPAPRRPLLQSASWKLPAILIGFNLIVTLFTARVPLAAFPNSGDEYAYLLQATLLARGKLYVESPPPHVRRFFDVSHVLNDGRYYGKYSPGWPAILSLGCLVGLPWVVNGLLGAATQALVYQTARRHFSIEAANLTLLILAGNPFFILNSASYFGHPAAALAIAVVYLAYFNWLEDPASRGNAALLGAAVGWGVLVRSFTTVTLGLPLGIHGVWRLWVLRKERKKDVLGSLAAAGAPLAVCAALFLGYNALTTGDPLLQPFAKLVPGDRPIIGGVALSAYGEWLMEFGLGRCGELACWLPFSVPLAAAAAFVWKGRTRSRIVLLAASAVCLLVAFIFYPSHGGNRYGPRYAYETMVALTLLSTACLASLPRLRAPLAALIVILNAFVFARELPPIRRAIVEKSDLYNTVAREKIENALVFIRTVSDLADAADLPRNGISFEGSVLYVRDLGEEDRELVREMPDRAPYYYDFSLGERRGRLTPFKLRKGD